MSTRAHVRETAVSSPKRPQSTRIGPVMQADRVARSSGAYAGRTVRMSSADTALTSSVLSVTSALV